jgi:hypothetical protein
MYGGQAVTVVAEVGLAFLHEYVDVPAPQHQQRAALTGSLVSSQTRQNSTPTTCTIRPKLRLCRSQAFTIGESHSKKTLVRRRPAGAAGVQPHAYDLSKTSLSIMHCAYLSCLLRAPALRTRLNVRCVHRILAEGERNEVLIFARCLPLSR